MVEKTVESGDYDSFIDALPTDECRYAVYDFEYNTGGEGKRNKILFYVWYVYNSFHPFVIFTESLPKTPEIK